MTPTPSSHSQDESFESLVRKERAWIGGDRVEAGGDGRPPHGAERGNLRVSTPGTSDEPWVWFSADDYFGIALSGGGIRSATYNLGLLQALEQAGLLAKADYLSTVSGGGYAGGFLTAWRHHHPHESFPLQAEALGQTHQRHAPPQHAANVGEKKAGARPTDRREPASIRHLREFSRFLMPRTGLFDGEMWNAVVTILGGVLPAIVFACAVLLVIVLGWLGVAYFLSWSPPIFGAAVMAAMTVGAMLYSESRREQAGKARSNELWTYAKYAILSTLLLVVAWIVVGYKTYHLAWMHSVAQTAGPVLDVLPDIGTPHAALTWLKANFDLWSSDWIVVSQRSGTMGGAYAPAVAWFGIALLLLGARAVLSRIAGGTDEKASVNWSGTLDRMITVFLVLGLLWSAMASVWLLARCLYGWMNEHAVARWLGGGTAASVGLFAWLRDWLNQPVIETRGTTLRRKLLVLIRPKIPQALAMAAVALLIASMALMVLVELQSPHPERAVVWTIGVAAVLIVGTLVTFDPARVGMHDFYRARISRCFLGAAQAEGDDPSRETTEQPDDDLKLIDLLAASNTAPDHHRALHLICCTANNVSGDALRGLYRGGRSAVLSAHGISIGNYHAALESVRLSSALTASAAAFNSQMGRLSMDFGPAVGFMMSALNLRLGLWVPHPLNPMRGEQFWRGMPYLFEMFGITNADIPDAPRRSSAPTSAGAETLPAAKDGGSDVEDTKWSRKRMTTAVEQVVGAMNQKGREFSRHSRQLHLSDGGHFENLALYELVRRHCRYVIVSDCGADPDVVFDDLAIALRTIREDFGVEIEIDVAPLRPDGNGQARQHAVVGTIHYDGPSGYDKGTLIYFKPSLTGDEPPDVAQYQSRNRTFPHETTGDQFYDEAQWESYRRLGQHSGNTVLRYIESFSEKRRGTQFVENVFLEATRLWQPAVVRQAETFLALTERRSALEQDIRENAPVFLRREFFPEVAFAPGDKKLAVLSTGHGTQEEEVNAVYILMRVAQLMEDVWAGAELDTNWAHPLNDGWMNYFHRWASTPSFRRWWPILRPIYSIGFRDFVRERFGLTYADGKNSATARLELVPESGKREGLAWTYWRQRNPGVVERADLSTLEYRLTLDDGAEGRQPFSMIVGLLRYRPKSGDVEWACEDLFVPPSLNGAGITARFLDAVMEHFRADQEVALNVTLGHASHRPDPASRMRRLHEVNFYKSRGFTFKDPGEERVEVRLRGTPGG